MTEYVLSLKEKHHNIGVPTSKVPVSTKVI